MSGRSPAPLRHATKKVRMISELLIMVQDSIYRQPGLTAGTTCVFAAPFRALGIVEAIVLGRKVNETDYILDVTIEGVRCNGVRRSESSFYTYSAHR